MTFKKAHTHKNCFFGEPKYFNSNTLKYCRNFFFFFFAVRTPYTTSSSSTTTFSCIHKRMNFFSLPYVLFGVECEAAAVLCMRERETFIFFFFFLHGGSESSSRLLQWRDFFCCAFSKILSHRNILVWVLIYFLRFTSNCLTDFSFLCICLPSLLLL